MEKVPTHTHTKHKQIGMQCNMVATLEQLKYRGKC